MNLTEFILLIVIGFAAGVFSGTLGVGGGIVLIPALIYIFGMSQHMAQGTSLAILLPPTGILAAITYNKQGFVHWKYAIIIMFIFVLGAWVGAKLAISLPEKAMKKVFAVFILFVGAKLLFSK